MRAQRLIIPMLFAVLLWVAYVVAAQTDEHLPDPYTSPSLVVLEAHDLVLPQGDALLVMAPDTLCEAQ